jgi:hypothetical protein
MTSLTVTYSDLESYLGETFDGTAQDRATFVLELVMDEAASIVSPVPSGAKGVVLSAAARIFTNPTGVSQELVGPYQTSRASSNLLTKAERSSLRRQAGGGGAFSFDLLGINGAADSTDYPDVRFPAGS